MKSTIAYMFAAICKPVTCLRGVVVLLSLAVSGLAEQPTLVAQALHTTEQFLREHNISITKEAVIDALCNSDDGVRRAASLVLSSRWPKEAAAPIQEAMLRENVELIRVSLASDLARLGDTAGREMLLAECHNSGEWGTTRMLAARSMAELNDDSCVDSVLEVLRWVTDPQDTFAKSDALELVPTFVHRMTDQEYQKVLDLVVNALSDPAPGVRLTAAIALGRLADPSAIPALEAALANEQDANLHPAMLIELKRLKGLQQDRDNRR